MNTEKSAPINKRMFTDTRTYTKYITKKHQVKMNIHSALIINFEQKEASSCFYC